MINNFYSKNIKRAFSLIELSIVLLIIGIIVAGATQSSRLILQFKLSSARSLTKSGPVPSIKGLSMWIEATSEESFRDIEAQDNNSGITVWYDLNPASSFKHNASVSTEQPLYVSNCINGLPCIRFDGDNDFMSFDGSFMAGNDYTIFIVEQRREGAAKILLGATTSNTVNNGFQFGYGTDYYMTFAQGGDIYLDSYYVVGGPSFFDVYIAPIGRLHTLVNSVIAYGGASSNTFNHYLNGSLTPTDKNISSGGDPATYWSTLSSYNNAALGMVGPQSSAAPQFYHGDVGEIIIYTRALKIEEKSAVQDYLLKKWGIAKAS